MTYNATVDINSLDLFNNLKYDQNPLYEKELRNIKYLPYDDTSHIADILVDTFNAMIVRKDTNYYGMSRSKKNNIMNHSNVLQSYQNELYDYLNLYNSWNKVLNNIPKSEWNNLLYNYEYLVYNFTIPEIIRLNKIINLQISIPGFAGSLSLFARLEETKESLLARVEETKDPDDSPKQNTKYQTYLMIIFIGLIISIIILILNGKNYYY